MRAWRVAVDLVRYICICVREEGHSTRGDVAGRAAGPLPTLPTGPRARAGRAQYVHASHSPVSSDRREFVSASYIASQYAASASSAALLTAAALSRLADRRTSGRAGVHGPAVSRPSWRPGFRRDPYARRGSGRRRLPPSQELDRRQCQHYCAGRLGHHKHEVVRDHVTAM